MVVILFLSYLPNIILKKIFEIQRVQLYKIEDQQEYIKRNIFKI